MEPGYSNRETGKAPTKQAPFIGPRRVYHFHGLLSEPERECLRAAREADNPTPNQELITHLERDINRYLQLLMEYRDSSGNRPFQVISGGRDWLTGIKVDGA